MPHPVVTICIDITKHTRPNTDQNITKQGVQLKEIIFQLF